ncbi:MAG: extradiol ring-cleavage dioxygenase [Chloroflexota bacterium]
MAEIVLGLGTSHSPQLSTPAEHWGLRADIDRRNPRLLWEDGEYYNFEQLLEKVDRAAIAREIGPDIFQKRWQECQDGIARVGEVLAEVNPDVVILLGDDQEEVYKQDNMPAINVYWGDTALQKPRHSNSEAARVSEWAYGDKPMNAPVASDLGLHIIESLIDDEYDIAHSRELKDGQGIGHAWTFVFHRVMHDRHIPVVPIHINTYYPPNQPKVNRCYELGQSVKRAVDSWKGNERVCVMSSGGLSHFVVLEEFDRKIVRAMQERDGEALRTLPENLFKSGTSEIKSWIAMSAATEHLDTKWLNYVPCYRSEAGTGCGMAFGHWA